MSNDNKINWLEITGNLAKDPRTTEQAVFITVATYNGKDKDGNKRPATFIDVSYFGTAKTKAKELKKGDRLNLKGKLSNFKDKQTGYTKLGVLGLSCNKLEKTKEVTSTDAEKEFEKELDKILTPPTKEEVEKEVPWELDL